MNALKKLLLRQTSKALRPYLQTHGLMRTSSIFGRSMLVHDPGAERVMVLAPHMDDEIIGCGGAIARHAQAGAQIQVVFLTDGRYGSTDLQQFTGDERKRREEAVVAVRKEEARRALAVLDIGNILFLDATDGKLAAETPGTAARLREALENFRPESVFLPCFLEQHPDHLAASAVLLEAVRGTHLDFHCFSYEVWTPLFPNCLIEIDSVIELKRRALLEYVSQLKDVDYLHTALALNAYRSAGVLSKATRHVEAYLAVGVEEYRSLYEAFRKI